MAQKDFYETLGVSKSATADEIKRAYRKLALEYHPDRNKTKDAESKFKEVTRAYEVLSDPQKRQSYDQFGSASGEQQQGQYGPFTYTYYTSGGGQNPNIDFDFGGFSDPFEIFEQFFGGASPFGSRQRRPTYSLTIDFMEAVNGVTKKVDIDSQTQSIKIPAGVDSNSRIRFGDYDVIVEVRPHPKFRREGYDIVSEEEISFPQATLGDTIFVDTIDDQVKLRIAPGTQSDTVVRLRGRGVPHIRGSGRGDHYVRVKVVIPKSLTRRQKELLQEFEKEKGKKGWF